MGLRRLLAPALALVGLGLMAAPAHAVFHLVKVTEAMPGTVNPSAEFVELRMYAPGQEFVAGHTVTLYSSASIPTGTCTFGGSVANGDDQRSILVATAAAVSEFGVTADCALTDANRLSPAGGAACWENLDCVAWGSIAGAATLPSPVGTPAPAIAAGASLTRSTAPGCPTLLEVSDDTNNSAADFALAVPSPANNAAPAAGSACTGGGGGGGDTNAPETKITKQPKPKTSKKKAKFKFTSSEQGSTFKCKLDKGGFKACNSPFKDKVDFGKHKFKVFATDPAGNPDPSPAKAKFKRTKR